MATIRQDTAKADTLIIDKRRTGEQGTGFQVKVSAKMAQLLMERYNVNGRRLILMAETKKVTAPVVVRTAENVAPIAPVVQSTTTEPAPKRTYKKRVKK